MHAATVEAVERARRGEGPEPPRDEDVPLPRPLAGPTRRSTGPRASSTRWKARDPIELLGAPLVADAIIGPNDAGEIRTEIQAEIDAAAERAASAPYPTLEETRPVCLR